MFIVTYTLAGGNVCDRLFQKSAGGGAKSVAFHHLHSNERKCHPQGLTLSNTFINDPDTGTGQSMCSASLQMIQSWEDWLIRQRVGCAAIQRDLGTLGTGTDRSLMKFNNRKCQVLPLGKNNPRHQNRLGPTCWKGPAVPLDTKLTMSR